MDHHFWTSRWEKNDIGFHKQQAHYALVRYFNRLKLLPGDTVLVPLCGKSLDMLWLTERGFRVIGTELSRIAIEDFFAENGLEAAQKDADSYIHYSTDNIELLCGDHFRLQRADLKGAAVVYDRGALVALPPALRRRYADSLTHLLPPAARILLVSYEYDQDEIAGPPFAVPRSEIKALFNTNFDIELLKQKDVLESHRGLMARGVSMLTEFVCLLTRRTD